MVVTALAGVTGINVLGNIYASNALTTTNVFTTNVFATGSVSAYGSNIHMRWSVNNSTAFPQGLASAIYYKIATLSTTTDNGNYSRFRISGTIGGWINDNSTGIDAYIISRGALNYGGTLTGYGGDGTGSCDIVIYLETNSTYTVYIKCLNYYYFDLLLWGEIGTMGGVKIFQCPITNTSITGPTGTLQTLTLTNACKTLVTTAATTVGKVGIGIAAPATTLDVSGDIACTGTLKAGNPLMFRNAIINGDFDVWQRGTSFSISAVPTYTSDRWRVNYDGTGATRTISRQTFTLGQTDVPGNPIYYLRWAQTVAGTTGTFNQVEQLIESVLTFAGQTVTVSFWAQAVSGTPTITSYVGQNFGTGGSPSAAVFPANSPTFTLSATWQKFTWTTPIPSITGKTLGTDGNDNVSFAFRAPSNAVGTWNIASIQVEAGSVATLFEARPYATELALCQRYYFRLVSSTTAQTDATFAVGVATSSSFVTLVVQFPVSMRNFPTFASSALNTFQVVSSANNPPTSLTLNANGSTLNCARLTGGMASIGSGNGCVLRANSTTSAFVEFSAEL